MRLPQVSYADGIKTAKQDEFAGLNHNLGAKDGELWDMRNLCSDYSPLLATRSRRMLYKTLQDPGGLFCWDKLCWVDGTTFYYDGVAKGTVTAGRKTFTALGAYIVIFPDKAYYTRRRTSSAIWRPPGPVPPSPSPTGNCMKRTRRPTASRRRASTGRTTSRLGTP